MKSFAFSPGHISGFFEPFYDRYDLAKTGSCGAGICITLGALSELEIEKSNSQTFEFRINDEIKESPVVELALKNLLGEKTYNVKVKTTLELPVSQGFGMSAASAVSSTVALSKLIGASYSDVIRASHFAEVQKKTGLGDVLASFFGGIEIRKKPGIPPWGLIEHIPGKYDLVLCVIGEELETKKILMDSTKTQDIYSYGRYCTKKLLEKPTVENFFKLSNFFTIKTNLADKKVLEAIEASADYGMASMCMLGNSVFAFGKTEELCKILSSYGKVFLASVDEKGARILK